MTELPFFVWAPAKATLANLRSVAIQAVAKLNVRLVVVFTGNGLGADAGDLVEIPLERRDFELRSVGQRLAIEAVRIASGDWPAVKTYIENGGRLWLQAEHQGCMTDVANLASFLSALGSAITWLGGSHDSNCATDGTRDCIAGAANIAQGVTFRMALTAELSGGTNVWQSPSARNMVQVEQLGSGFLFVSGDSNLFDGCSYDNCEFAQRLLNYADDQIL